MNELLIKLRDLTIDISKYQCNMKCTMCLLGKKINEDTYGDATLCDLMSDIYDCLEEIGL